jgi:acyl transferase domain-containing protein
MKRAVVICPGRGTYNKAELGNLKRLHSGKKDLFAAFDAIRTAEGQETLEILDGADRFSLARHTRGDNASALIFAATYADFLSVKDIEIVAVTGNSMGWYSALACGGALEAVAGFRLVNTMGTLMQEALIGGQLVYPVTGDNWRPDTARRAELIACVDAIHEQPDHFLAVSIDLGGMLVLAGNEAGLSVFEKSVPVSGQFPMRLANHAAFHTALQAPVAEKGRAAIPAEWFGQPTIPMIDGRGAIWWPHATDPAHLRDYTLGHQVVEPYDFAKAVTVAAREFAPDCFIVTGPGTTLGGSVAQSLIAADWQGMKSKQDFLARQETDPIVISMGREDQRALVM